MGTHTASIDSRSRETVMQAYAVMGSRIDAGALGLAPRLIETAVTRGLEVVRPTADGSAVIVGRILGRTDVQARDSVPLATTDLFMARTLVESVLASPSVGVDLERYPVGLHLAVAP